MSWLDTLSIETIVGDIFEQEVEAVVCNVNVGLDLDHYSLGRELLRREGPALSRRTEDLLASRAGRPFGLGEAATVSLEQCGGLRWAVLAAWWSHDNEYTQNLLYMIHVNALRQAFAVGATSVAFPLIGRGARALTLQDMARTVGSVFRALGELRTSSGFSVCEVTFVSKQEPDIDKFRRFLRKEPRLLVS